MIEVLNMYITVLPCKHDRQTDRQTDTHTKYRNPLARGRRGLILCWLQKKIANLSHLRNLLTSHVCIYMYTWIQMSIITCAGVSGHTPGWQKRTAKCTEYTELASSSRPMSEYYESLGSSEKVGPPKGGMATLPITPTGLDGGIGC